MTTDDCTHGCRWAADEVTRLGQEMEMGGDEMEASENGRREVALDGAGQALRVGDQVGGVRLGRYPVTLVGHVVKLGRVQARVRVVRSDRRADVKPGDEVLVYLSRTFKVAEILSETESEGTG